MPNVARDRFGKRVLGGDVDATELAEIRASFRDVSEDEQTFARDLFQRERVVAGVVSDPRVFEIERQILSIYLNAPDLISGGEYTAESSQQWFNTPLHQAVLSAMMRVAQLTPASLVGMLANEPLVKDAFALVEELRTFKRYGSYSPSVLEQELWHARSELRIYSCSAESRENDRQFRLGYYPPKAKK